MLVNHFLPGFDRAVEESQCYYRTLLKSMSEPGLIQSLVVNDVEKYANVALLPTTWIIIKTLCDADNQLFLSSALSTKVVCQSIQFHTDASVIDSSKESDFSILNLEDWQSLADYATGSIEAPHQSATLIIQVESLTNEKQLVLSGPGIKTHRHLSIAGLSDYQQQLLIDNHKLYPCGIDFIFCSPTHIACIPRSTSVSTLVEE